MDKNNGIVIFLNGEYDYDNNFIREKIKNKLIFCADGGANYLYNMGVIPDCIIGDLDSISSRALKFFEDKNVMFEKFKRDKDFSDYELILKKVFCSGNFSELSHDVSVFGAFGKRIDFTFNNVFLLEKYPKVKYFSNKEIMFFRDSSFNIENQKGKKISFISLNEQIIDLTLLGFKFDLEKITVDRSSSLLMSNEIVKNNVQVNFKKGKVLVIIQNSDENKLKKNSL